MSARTLKEAFCARHHCSAAAYHTAAFRRCLYPHALPLAWLIRLLRPSFFAEDDLAIEQAGLRSSVDQVRAVLEDFGYINRTQPHWMRTRLRLRVSGRRIQQLALDLLGEEEPISEPSATQAVPRPVTPPGPAPGWSDADPETWAQLIARQEPDRVGDAVGPEVVHERESVQPPPG